MQNFSHFSTQIIRYNHKSWLQVRPAKRAQGTPPEIGEFLFLDCWCNPAPRRNEWPTDPLRGPVVSSPSKTPTLSLWGVLAEPRAVGTPKHFLVSLSLSSLYKPEAEVGTFCSQGGVMRAEVLWSARTLIENTALKTLDSLGNLCLLVWLVFSSTLLQSLHPPSFPEIELQIQLQDVYTIGYQMLSVSFLIILSLFSLLLICWYLDWDQESYCLNRPDKVNPA